MCPPISNISDMGAIKLGSALAQATTGKSLVNLSPFSWEIKNMLMRKLLETSASYLGRLTLSPPRPVLPNFNRKGTPCRARGPRDPSAHLGDTIHLVSC